MATQKPGTWVQSLITRFDTQLPIKTGIHTTHSMQNVEQNKECLIEISKHKFPLVINGLTKTLQAVDNVKVIGMDAERNLYDSQIMILDTLEKVLNSQPKETSRLDETMYVRLLLPELCKFLTQTNETNTQVVQLRNLASKVLFALSLHNFTAVFSKISARLATLSTPPGDDSSDFTDLELIQHINVDFARLIKLLNEVSNKFKLLKKPVQLNLATNLEKAIWHSMENYPDEFGELQKKHNDELTDCCDRLFEHYYAFSESCKKVSVWPLQMMLLVLCPTILEEIINADNGAPCSPQHLKKKKVPTATLR